MKNKEVKIYIKNVNDTINLANKFALLVKNYNYLFLYLDGYLGTGKSFFCNYLIKKLGFNGLVKSPSYSLVNKYKCKFFRIFHFDFFRINSLKELYDIDIDNYFSYYNNSLYLIEWSKKFLKFLPIADLHFFFSLLNNEKRIIIIKSFSNLGNSILNLGF